jgi:hypothetical protein
MKSYDHLPVNYQTSLDLRMTEATGTTTSDWSKTHKEPVTLVGTPIWRVLPNDLMTLDFNPANPDYLTILAASCADLGFTASDFSGAAWFRPHAVGNRYIFNKSDGLSGWYFYIDANGSMNFVTCQAGPITQVTIGNPLTLNVWQLVAFVRDGANVDIYTNGEKANNTLGTHINPAASAALNLYIGSTNLGAAGWLDGDLYRPRIFPKALTAATIRSIFNYERGLLEV